MNRAGWLSGLVAVAVAGAVVVAGQQVAAPSAAMQQPAARTELLTGAVQACPALDVPEVSTTVATTTLADAPDDADDLAGRPRLELLALTGEPPLTPLRATTLRGQTLVLDDAPSTVARATGALSPGLTGQATMTAAGERTTGLASQPCMSPARQWWFAAGSGEVGRRATLVLTNPGESAAVVDVELWTESGPLAASGTSDLGVPAGGSRSVSLDAVAIGSQRVGVHVSTQVGRVGAALALREIDGADPQGLAWVSPSRPPTTLAYVPGVPGAGQRTLRVVNPTEQDAIVGLRVLGPLGTFTPVGLEAIDAPAGRVVDVDLAEAGDEAFALEVSSTAPVVSSVVVRRSPRGQLSDLAVIGSSPTLDSSGAAALSTQDGRRSRLVLSSVPQSPTTQVVVAVTDLAGTTQRAEVVTVQSGHTVTVPVDPVPGQDRAWVLVEPVDAGLVLALLETTATVTAPEPLDPDENRDAFWFDVAVLTAAPVSVEVSPVVADLSVGQRAQSAPL